MGILVTIILFFLGSTLWQSFEDWDNWDNRDD